MPEVAGTYLLASIKKFIDKYHKGYVVEIVTMHICIFNKKLRFDIFYKNWVIQATSQIVGLERFMGTVSS